MHTTARYERSIARCQGEGREFESRHPLDGNPLVTGGFDVLAGDDPQSIKPAPTWASAGRLTPLTFSFRS